MSKTVKTSKGSELPLINLKGRDYLMVAYRLQWLSDDVERYTIATNLEKVDDEQTIARACVTIYNKEGVIMRQAQATKRETKKDFADHTEKAETAAIGRALSMVGYGTQHALADFDEGERLADSPLKAVEAPTTPLAATPAAEPTKAATSFRKPPRPTTPATLTPAVEVVPTKLNF